MVKVGSMVVLPGNACCRPDGGSRPEAGISIAIRCSKPKGCKEYGGRASSPVFARDGQDARPPTALPFRFLFRWSLRFGRISARQKRCPAQIFSRILVAKRFGY